MCGPFVSAHNLHTLGLGKIQIIENGIDLIYEPTLHRIWFVVIISVVDVSNG